MSTLKEEREAIARDIHFKYLAKAKTAKIDGSELTVLPYGYLSQAVEEALLSHEDKVMERVRENLSGVMEEMGTNIQETAMIALAFRKAVHATTLPITDENV